MMDFGDLIATETAIDSSAAMVIGSLQAAKIYFFKLAKRIMVVLTNLYRTIPDDYEVSVEQVGVN